MGILPHCKDARPIHNFKLQLKISQNWGCYPSWSHLIMEFRSTRIKLPIQSGHAFLYATNFLIFLVLKFCHWPIGIIVKVRNWPISLTRRFQFKSQEMWVICFWYEIWMTLGSSCKNPIFSAHYYFSFWWPTAGIHGDLEELQESFAPKLMSVYLWTVTTKASWDFPSLPKQSSSLRKWLFKNRQPFY